MDLETLIKGSEREREIGKLQPFNYMQKDSLVEAFVSILRTCKRLKDVVDNTDFVDFLRSKYKGEKKYKSFLALYNLIFSSYTKENEASAKQFIQIRLDAIKDNPELQNQSEIEVLLSLITASFKVILFEMQVNKFTNLPEFHTQVEKFLESDFASQIEHSITLTKLLECIWGDFNKANPQGKSTERPNEIFEILKSKKAEVAKFFKDFAKAPLTLESLLNWSTFHDYDDEESEFFNQLILSFKKAFIAAYGDKFNNPQLLKPVEIDLLQRFCVLKRYDMENQVNFGFIDLTFDYLSFLKTLKVNVTSVYKHSERTDDNIVSKANEPKKESTEMEMGSSMIQINVTEKMTITGYEQKPELLKLPKFRDVVAKLHEICPETDFENDYDIMIVYQARHEEAKMNQFRFLTLEDRITEIQVGNPSNQVFSMLTMDNKRLCDPHAIKIFYSFTIRKSGLMTEKLPAFYVTFDNDESISHLVKHMCQFHFKEGNGTDTEVKKFEENVYKNMYFFLPSTFDNDEEMEKWKKVGKEILKNLNKNSPVYEVFEELRKIYKKDVFPEKDLKYHHYMNCWIDWEKVDKNLSAKGLEMPENHQFEKAAKKNMRIVLNPGLTEIINYSVVNERNRFNKLSNIPKGDPSFNCAWNLMKTLPVRAFLPNYLFVRVVTVNKLLELHQTLDLDYLAEYLNKSKFQLTSKYRTIGLICQKKRAPGTNTPLEFYPVIKKNNDKFDKKFLGFLPKQVEAEIFKIDKELVHYIFFEREDIEF